MLFMLITLIGGADILGAKRWINIGPISFQPSEFVKIIVVLIVAKYYSDYKKGIITTSKCLMVIVCICLGLVLFVYFGQKDLGTTIICVIGILALL